ncbi:hypothetical protein SEA_WOOPER_56 [Gordonia phage Wooper]|nr:hypothetical protein SEA_WOOPER_56 [Gordonia phage Wooper]
MTPTDYLLDNYDAIKALPDGSLISWLRVPGDESSEAAAFVRHEGDDTWLSPGGWDPLPISAVDLPAQIVRFGPVGSAFADSRVRLYEQACNGEEIGHAEAVIARETAEDLGLPWDPEVVRVCGEHADSDDGEKGEDVAVIAPYRVDEFGLRQRALDLAVQWTHRFSLPNAEGVVLNAKIFADYLRGEETEK